MNLARFSSVASLAMLLAACSSGTGEEANEQIQVPESSAQIQTEETNAQIQTEETNAQIQAEEAYAEIHAPEIVFPVVSLAAEHGGPRQVDTVCLDVTSEVMESGRPEVYVMGIESNWSDVLHLLGIDTDPSAGCDLTLRVSLSGRRIGATYDLTRTCFTGWDVWTDVDLVVGGDVTGQWQFHDRREPPETIQESQCASSDVAIGYGRVFVEMFESVFGHPGLVATDIILGVDEFVEPFVVDDTTIAMLVNGWSSDTNTRPLALTIVQWLGMNDANRDLLLPHLIEALAHEELGDEESVGNGLELELEDCLRFMTGVMDLDTAIEWWEWWQTQHE